MSKSELDYFKQFETTFKMQQLRATRDGNEDRNPLLFGLAQWIDEEETKRLCAR